MGPKATDDHAPRLSRTAPNAAEGPMVRAAVADVRARAGPQRCLEPEDLVFEQIFSMRRV